jgi:glycosyltransferase involved in cell wall biosynthesis
MKITNKESNKHIAIFLPGLYDGGAERVMLNLASGMVNLGYKVDLVLVQVEGPFVDKVPDEVRVIELNKKHRSTLRTILSLPSFVRYLKQEQPKALLSGLNYANIIAVWAKLFARVPLRLSITEHNTFSSEKKGFPPLFRWVLYWLMKFSYQMADEIIAVSEGVADDLVKELGFQHGKVRVIYNPIITPELREKIKQPLQDTWFATKNIPIVLAMGRFTRQKGFDTLIRAFAEVKKQRPVRLLILGEGEDRTNLQNLCKELNIDQEVRLPGFISNPYPYLVNASLFVLSSRWEGLPTVLVEALYCGIPIVATDCPSGPREILKNGLYGQLVPVDDAESLARAMLTALDGEKPSIPPISWQAFDINTVIQQYISVVDGNS